MPIHLTGTGNQNIEGKLSVTSGDSDQWTLSFTTVQANSAAWGVGSDVSGLSSNWQSTYNTVRTLSSGWGVGEGSDVSSLSSNWQSTYTTVGSNSANWNNAYNSIFSLSSSLGGTVPQSLGGTGTATGSISSIGNWSLIQNGVSAIYSDSANSVNTTIRIAAGNVRVGKAGLSAGPPNHPFESRHDTSAMATTGEFYIDTNGVVRVGRLSPTSGETSGRLIVQDRLGGVVFEMNAALSTGTFNAAVTTNQAFTISNPTESSSIGTGSLKVSGGAGIVKNLYVGGNGSFVGSLSSASLSTRSIDCSSIKVIGGIASTGALILSAGGTNNGISLVPTGTGGFTWNTGVNTIRLDTLFATYPGIWFGTNAAAHTVSNYAFLYDNGTVLNSPFGTTLQYRIHNSNVLTASASATSILQTTESFNISSGSLRVYGGVGILKNLNVGGSGSFTGTISAINLSGINTGNDAPNSLYSSLVSNATHTGDAIGSTSLTVIGLNGTTLASLSTGLIKNTNGSGVPLIAVSGTDYVSPSGSEFLTNKKIPLVTKVTNTNYTIGTTDPVECYGGVIYVTGAATITIPAVVSGMSFTVITIGNIAVSVDPNAADLIYLDGVALADGNKITNTSSTGDSVVFTYFDSTGWYATSNNWTDGGA
jgi:hypothetical protein